MRIPNKRLNSSIRSINETLTDTTTLDKSGPGSYVNEGILYIPQSSRTEASPRNYLESYQGYCSLVEEGGSYSSAKMQLMYSPTPADSLT